MLLSLSPRRLPAGKVERRVNDSVESGGQIVNKSEKSTSCKVNGGIERTDPKLLPYNERRKVLGMISLRHKLQVIGKKTINRFG
jgi:hypothetical protein